MTRKWWVGVGVRLLVAGAAGFWGRDLTLDIQRPIYASLQSTAGIVFGVVGVWLAVIYPDVLQALTQWRQDGTPASPRVMHLFPPLIIGAATVATVAVATLLIPAVEQTGILGAAPRWCQGGSFALLAFLTILQVEALWAATTPILGVGDRLRSVETTSQIRSRFAPPRGVTVRDEAAEQVTEPAETASR